MLQFLLLVTTEAPVTCAWGAMSFKPGLKIREGVRVETEELSTNENWTTTIDILSTSPRISRSGKSSHVTTANPCSAETCHRPWPIDPLTDRRETFSIGANLTMRSLEPGHLQVSNTPPAVHTMVANQTSDKDAFPGCTRPFGNVSLPPPIVVVRQALHS